MYEVTEHNQLMRLCFDHEASKALAILVIRPRWRRDAVLPENRAFAEMGIGNYYCSVTLPNNCTLGMQ